MPRITVELSTEEHRALKLLSILENKKLGSVLKEAIHAHLLNKGAQELTVTGQQGSVSRDDALTNSEPMTGAASAGESKGGKGKTGKP